MTTVRASRFASSNHSNFPITSSYRHTYQGNGTLLVQGANVDFYALWYNQVTGQYNYHARFLMVFTV